MALGACRECGRQISTDATTCPHCGKRNPTRAQFSLGMGCVVLIGGVMLIGLSSSLFDSTSTPSRPPVPSVPSPEAERRAAAFRTQADSLLRVVQPRQVSALERSQIGLMLNHGDSTLNSELFATLRHEEARRAAASARERTAARARHLLDLARSYRFDDGSRCRRASPDRINQKLRAHPDWSDSDLLGVACGAVWIGMTAEQLRESWGRPRDINRTVTARGAYEQWVYGQYGSYVYLQDGIVTSWQN